MTTPFTDDDREQADQPPPDETVPQDEPYVRLPIDPHEPMASWLAIL
ncbi:hypothetical protein [Actinomadura litoris]|uniref:Uncharacterized protein n=1 Tax=Actinomadura litoris TaxID=2678616 RepID=A0A7K1LB84_9ACTN|nr:hypothetical protein [Actinomadura litoris]MUN41687.1 hypothetical protein [Actinomadura litoris]